MPEPNLAEVGEGQLPILVFRAVENAQACMKAGDFEKALKMTQSMDEFCIKKEAPPPLHALVLRVMAENYAMMERQDEAREVTQRAISLVKPLTKRKDDMNEFMKADVFNRMGDLLSTLGDIEMSIEGRAKQGLRKSAEHYNEIPACTEREANAMGRVGLILFMMEKWEESLEALQQQDHLLRNCPEAVRSDLNQKYLGNCLANQGCCYQRMGNTDLAVQIWEQALPISEAANDVQEVTNLKGLLAGKFD